MSGAAAAAGRAGAGWVGTSRALMMGNFAIGCGVMVVAGSLNNLAQDLQVAPAVAGQLITAGALAMGTGAPLLAAALAGCDRRRLLTLALLWFAAGHALAALMPSYTALLPMRVLSLLAAAVFTPQAAGAIAALAPPEQRGRAITAVFMGWSLSSVLGMPLHSYIAEAAGWRWAFGLVSLLGVAAAWGVWRRVPAGVRPPTLSWQAWRDAITHPLRMALVVVTLFSAAGQFTLFSYLSPYYRQVLGASATQVSLLFFWFGAFGLLGNLLMSRWIDRLGAARCVQLALALMALALLLWPLTGPAGPARGMTGMALVLMPWALGCFAGNSALQAWLSQNAPGYASALLALNTSAIYAGQALGAAGGGALLAAGGFGPLPWAGLGWMLLALGLSTWAARTRRRADAA